MSIHHFNVNISKSSTNPCVKRTVARLLTLKFFIASGMNLSRSLRPSPGGTKMCSFPSVACPFAGWTRLRSIDKTCVRRDGLIGVHFDEKHARLPFAKSSINPCIKRTCGQLVSRDFFNKSLVNFILQLVFALCRVLSALRLSCSYAGPPVAYVKCASFPRWRAHSPGGPPQGPPSRRHVCASRHASSSTLSTFRAVWRPL